MANRTDPRAKTVHGTNPQFLLEQILRNRIYSNPYWKEQCFGLTAETLVDKAMELKYFGGTYGGNKKPTPFMCLVLKLLQIQPEKEIIIEFIKNEDYRYVRLLGAFYLRLTGKPVEVYKYLEPLYYDYRKVRKRTADTVVATYVDEFIDELLTGDYSLDVVLPHITKRRHLEQQGLLEPRKSALEEDLEIASSDDEQQNEAQQEGQPGSLVNNTQPHGKSDKKERSQDRSRSPSHDGQSESGSKEKKGRELDRNRKGRSRSRSRSKERKPRGRSRSKERKRRGRSRSKSRSSSYETRRTRRDKRASHQKRSRSRSRSRERRHRGRGRSKSGSSSRSSSRSKERRRSGSRDRSNSPRKRHRNH